MFFSTGSFVPFCTVVRDDSYMALALALRIINTGLGLIGLVSLGLGQC